MTKMRDTRKERIGLADWRPESIHSGFSCAAGRSTAHSN